MSDPRCSCDQLLSQHVGPGGSCICCRCPGFTDDPSPVESLVCGQWTLRLLPHRAYRWARAWHEAARLCALHSVIRDGDTVYDVGGEQGDFAALFATWGAKVVVVEPNQACWPLIKASFDANGVRPHGWARGFLADHAWKTDANRDVETGRSGWPDAATGELVAAPGYQRIGDPAEETPATTLDALAKRIACPPDVVTIDVEGGELHVLRGAREVLAELRPIVFVSIHEAFLRDLHDIDADDVHELMADLGYERTHLATDHEAHFMYWHPQGRQP